MLYWSGLDGGPRKELLSCIMELSYSDLCSVCFFFRNEDVPAIEKILPACMDPLNNS